MEHEWQRSSKCSTSHCVETKWVRSTRCANGGCVEMADTEYEVLVRDSKNPDGPVLRYTRAEWRDFVAGVKAGEFDW